MEIQHCLIGTPLMNDRKKIVINLLLLCIICLFANGCKPYKKELKSPPLQLGNDSSLNVQFASFLADQREKLKSAGFENKTIDQIYKVNTNNWVLIFEENPQALEPALRKLYGIGAVSGINEFLVQFPETAFLLTISPQPEQIMQVFQYEIEDDDLFESLFVFHAEAQQSSLLAEAIESDGDLIYRMYERGLQGAEQLFMFKRTNPGMREYDNWLREVITSGLTSDDESLASIYTFLLTYQHELKYQFAADLDIREHFQSKYWPIIKSFADRYGGSYDLLLSSDQLFAFIKEPFAKEMLSQSGMVAVGILYGMPEADIKPCDTRLHEVVKKALVNGDMRIIHVATSFGDDPDFIDLMTRDIPDETRISIASEIINAGPNASERMDCLSHLINPVLIEEVGYAPQGFQTWIPFYDAVWNVPKKLLQGRPVSGMEYFLAAIDPVCLAIEVTVTVATVGTATVPTAVGIKTLKEGAKTITKNGIKRTAKAQVAELTKKLAKKQIGKRLAGKLSKEFTEYQFSRTAATILLGSKFKKGALVNVTHFCKNNAGKTMKFYMNKSFRALPVIVKRTSKKSLLAIYLIKETTENAVGEVVLEMPWGEQGLEMICDGVVGGKKYWKEQIAAYWFLKASDAHR